MKSDHPTAEEILKRTLVEVRSVRMRRQVWKGSLGAVVVLAAAISLWPRPGPLQGPARTSADAVPSPLPVAEEKLAVMVWRDGTPRLEWIALHDLGSLELQFSLEPVFAFADDGM